MVSNETGNPFASWKGREFFQGLLLEQGISVWSAFQRNVICQCDEAGKGTLERYWNETAKEYVSAGGRANVLRRDFGGAETYRSAFIDNIVRDNGYDVQAKRTLPLHPCARKFQSRIVTEIGFGAALTSAMEIEKAKEINDAELYAFRRAGVVGGWRSLLEAQGGIALTKNKFKVAAAQGRLSLILVIDGENKAGGHLLGFLAGEGGSNVFEVTDLSPVVPGIGYYSVAKTEEVKLWGARCHAMSLIQFAKTF